MLKCEQLKVQGNPNNIPSLIINSLHKYKHYGECRKKNTHSENCVRQANSLSEDL